MMRWIAGGCLVMLAVSLRSQTVDVWLTTADQTRLLQPQASVAFSNATGGDNPLLIDEAQVYQEIEGFGASFTDSAAYLLNQVATPAARTNAMNNLFTRNGMGIGVGFVRNPMGASDLARFHYSYDDNPPGGADPGLIHFSISHDQADIIPLIQQALALNPQLKIMGNPWSPPGWMKDSGSMIGGSLLPAMRSAYADYFVKYIQAYESAGIPIHYISLQNEPLYVPGDYPGMGMDAATQRDVLRDFVLPAFAAANLTTRVLVYDHNWDGFDYPATVLSDPTLAASPRVAGIAWHGYGGTPGIMLGLAESFPTKGNYQTEHSGGVWVGGDANQIVSDFLEITHVMRSWGRAYVKWSLVLDQDRGPNSGGCDTCTPLVTVNTGTGDVSYNVDYYTLGHFSKFVLPGARRVYSGNGTGLVSAAFLNPDGSKVLVVFNDGTTAQAFQVHWGDRSFAYTLPGFSGTTFSWTGTQTGTSTCSATNRIMASSFNTVSGLLTEVTSDTVGGYNLGYADNGDYAVYQNVSFPPGLTNVSARIASFGGGSLEFRLNSPNGPILGSLAIPDTGGWQSWETISGPITNVPGLYDLYVVFRGGSSVGNLNWFQFSGVPDVSAPGAASQLIWTLQPGLATNGLPFAQQPVLQTADAQGIPTTNGLPPLLAVVVEQSAGLGPLSGTTNLNIGSLGWNGSVQFSDLLIHSAGTGNELTASTPAVTNTLSDNLLLNGDFNSPASGDPPDHWAAWVVGGGWANHENNVGITYDGSHYMVVGGYEDQGGGCSQTVPATPGVEYRLSVLSGADAWWLPYGEMRLFFLGESDQEVGSSLRPTLNPPDYGGAYDIPHPWEVYTLGAVAPENTARARVEFISTGTGSIWYENAVLAEAIPAPLLASATTQPFDVHPASSSPGMTNRVVGFTEEGAGRYTLQFTGTVGTEYVVQTTTNLSPPIVWDDLAGSRHAVTNLDGTWAQTISNNAPQRFYRSAEVLP